MKLNRSLVVSVSLLTLASLAVALDGAALKYTAHEGDSHKYKLTAKMEVSGSSAIVTADVVSKILKVDDSGNVTIQESQKNVSVDLGGQTVNPEDSPAMVRVVRPDGTTSEMRGDAATNGAIRFTNLQTVKLPDFPMEKDKVWSWDVESDAKTGAVKQHSDYKVLGDEKVDGIDCWKISVDTKELEGDAPGKVMGTVWLSKKDGLLVKLDGKGENLPVPGQPITMTGTMSLELSTDTSSAADAGK